MQPLDTSAPDHVWYARPVFYVTDIQRALRFYVEGLSFTKKWHEGDGEGSVCQVDRGGCELILFEDADRTDRGRLFLELSKEAVDHLMGELDAHSLPTQRAWWGYDVLEITDPDGNELLVCLENLLPERPKVAAS
jgi:catechol 2,3-dioxygenase-like lactoylglutathione lyase family enzyme